MRSLVIYCLLVATLLPTVSPWGIIAHYQLNKEYIARVLCENRNKPQLHCDGKCYLAKRLKDQQDKQDKETTERVQRMASMQLFCESQPAFSFLKPTTFIHRPGFTYQTRSYPTPIRWLLKPPCRLTFA